MNIILENIYRDILELSDLNLQTKVWLGQDPKYVSSYVELMCRLFDDNNFDNFLSHTAGKMFSEESVHEFEKLRDALNAYEEKETDKEILADPEWQAVVKQARLALILWDRDLPSGGR